MGFFFCVFLLVPPLFLQDPEIIIFPVAVKSLDLVYKILPPNEQWLNKSTKATNLEIILCRPPIALSLQSQWGIHLWVKVLLVGLGSIME